MEVTSGDIRFLTGLSKSECDKMVYDVAGESCLTKKGTVKQGYKIDVSDIKRKLLSVYESMDGENYVENAIKLIKQHGISYSLRKEIYEDMRNLYYRELRGKYKILNKILDKNQLDDIKKVLSCRRDAFVCSGGKFPRNLL